MGEIWKELQETQTELEVVEEMGNHAEAIVVEGVDGGMDQHTAEAKQQPDGVERVAKPVDGDEGMSGHTLGIFVDI